jgi:Protein of unknown function (DUF4019)
VDTVATDKNDAEKTAVESATRWLALQDDGNLAASWEESAQHLKSSVSKAQWTRMLRARVALGSLKSRKILSATYTKATLPGAPEGQFVVIYYESSFEHKTSAVEMVTPMLLLPQSACSEHRLLTSLSVTRYDSGHTF